jgi:hypothetical protein
VASSLAKTLRDHAKQVARLEDTQARDFLDILKQTEIEITGRLASVSDADTPFSVFQLQRVLGEVKAAIGGLEIKAVDLYGTAQSDAIDLAVEHTVGELTRSLSLVDDELPNAFSLNLDAAAGMSDPAQMLLANHFESSVQRYGIDVLNAVRRRVQVGMITGDPSKTVVADVQRAFAGTKPQAVQLVRTETSSAYGAAQHRSIKEAADQVPGLKKMWIHQSSYKCDVCIGLDGTERPMDGTWTIKIGKKTKKVAHAPAHNNCTCRVVAMKPSWKDKLGKLGYLDPKSDDSED